MVAGGMTKTANYSGYNLAFAGINGTSEPLSAEVYESRLCIGRASYENSSSLSGSHLSRVGASARA